MKVPASDGSVIANATIAREDEAVAPSAERSGNTFYRRFEHLSKSQSGLHYVRDRRNGFVRLLTDEELNDFNDPTPCPECGEQFGCEHYNCAGEPLLSESEIESAVPAEWRAFGREEGLSRNDLDRLRTIGEHEGEYRVASGAPTDMRTLELVLLLNESR